MITSKIKDAGKLSCASIVAIFIVAAPAFAHSCAEELPTLEAQIVKMPDTADKNTATHQYERAKERLSAGKEKSCLRYVESARAAIEAWQMHDDD